MKFTMHNNHLYRRPLAKFNQFCSTFTRSLMGRKEEGGSEITLFSLQTTLFLPHWFDCCGIIVDIEAIHYSTIFWNFREIC